MSKFLSSDTSDVWKSFDQSFIESFLSKRLKSELNLIALSQEVFCMHFFEISGGSLFLKSLVGSEMKKIHRELQGVGANGFLYVYHNRRDFFFRVRVFRCILEKDVLIVPLPRYALFKESRQRRRRLVHDQKATLLIDGFSKRVDIINFHEYGAQIKIKGSLPVELSRGHEYRLEVGGSPLKCSISLRYQKYEEGGALLLGLAFSEYVNPKIKYLPEHLQNC